MLLQKSKPLLRTVPNPKGLRPDTPICPIAVSGPWFAVPVGDTTAGSTSVRDDRQLVNHHPRRPLAEVIFTRI
jgi:hypothetical protein